MSCAASFCLARAVAWLMASGVAALLCGFGLSAAAQAGEGAPSRVVSINLCSDQLALLLAAPGQVVSVSHWSAMESASNVAPAARRLPLNQGSAEQVFLMQPDLVLAGSFSNRTAINLLRRLGIRVETLPSAHSLADVSDIILRTGRLLGREQAAAEMERAFTQRLGALAARAAKLTRQSAAYHYPNNYTSGAETLADRVLDRAGLDNAAAAFGLTSVAKLDLERLVMLRPFLIRTAPLSGTEIGRAYESAQHPALSGLTDRAGGTVLPERWQTCGTPFVLEAIAALITAREAPH